MTEEAIELYEKVVAAKPDDEGTWSRLGTLYIKNDQVDEAVELLKNVELSITGINIENDKK
jgi:tetratricopeptide (TPR) repeat protein